MLFMSTVHVYIVAMKKDVFLIDCLFQSLKYVQISYGVFPTIFLLVYLQHFQFKSYSTALNIFSLVCWIYTINPERHSSFNPLKGKSTRPQPCSSVKKPDWNEARSDQCLYTPHAPHGELVKG